MSEDKKPTGVPQYRLTERAYLNDKLYETGDVIYWKDPPGAHMLPLNDAARAMVMKYEPTWLDPISGLPTKLEKKEAA